MINIQAGITDIMVFSDRARVTRRGKIELGFGEHILVVEGLPSTLEEDSVRAGGAGANVRIVDVEVKAQFVQRTPEPDYTQIEQELDTLAAQEDRLTDELAIEEAKLQFLHSLRDSSSVNLGKAIADGRFNIRDVSDISGQLGDQLATVYARRREIQKRQTEIENQMSQLESALPSGYRATRRHPPNVPDIEDANTDDHNERYPRLPFARRGFGENRPPSPFGLRSTLNEGRSGGSPFGGSSSTPFGSSDSPFRHRLGGSSSSAPTSNRRYNLYVRVDVQQETVFTLEVYYMVMNASWEPVYDIRLQDEGINVHYQALVRQHSGEDWYDVPLTLSTARPTLSAEVPQLRPWYLDRQGPRIAQFPTTERSSSNFGNRYLPAAGSSRPFLNNNPPPFARPTALSPMESDEELIMDSALEIERLELAGASPNVTYQALRPIAVLSNGNPHKATLAEFELDVELDYVAVPKLAEEAYLRAKVHNSSDYFFLAGVGHVFRDSEYVGKTDVPATSSGEAFAVQLGVDNRIRITRQLVERNTSRNRAGNIRRTQFAYKITIVNLLPFGAHLTLFDQLPVSKNDEIKVQVMEIVPEPTEHTTKGILKWQLDLKPNEEREFTVAFTLEHPRTMNVSGFS